MTLTQELTPVYICFSSSPSPLLSPPPPPPKQVSFGWGEDKKAIVKLLQNKLKKITLKS